MHRLLLIFLMLVGIPMVHGSPYKIGVITDFDRNVQIDSILSLMVNEIDRVTGSNHPFSFDLNQDVSFGISSKLEAQQAYNQVSGNSDYVILFGNYSVIGGSELGQFSKPTIAIGFMDPQLLGLPFENGRSKQSNFTYIWPAKGLKDELMVCQEIVPFRSLNLIVDQSSFEIYSQEKGRSFLASLEDQLSLKLNITLVEDFLSQPEASLNSEAEAVFLPFLQNIYEGDIGRMADELIQLDKPSFSSQKSYVDQGILGCIADKNDYEQIIRKIAVMIDESINGAPFSEMLVKTTFKEGLYINARTARELEIPLSFEVLFTANMIEEGANLPTYSVQNVLEIALENNFAIKISNQDISLALQDAKLAKTAILPQLDLGVSGRQINSESAFSFLDQPESKITGQLNFEQIIYSEEVMAGIKIAYYLQKAQESATRAQILEVCLNTYLDYLAVLAAKAALQIDKENLENFKTNLELAKLRVSSGEASKAEILRWESEVATTKQQVVNSSVELFNAKFKLNTTLANTLEEDFDIADVTINDELYKQFSESEFAKFIQRPKDVELVTDFFIVEALNHNPNKLALLEQINAIKRRKLQNKRLLYTPNIALQAQMSQVLYRGGKGSDVSDLNIPDNTWNVGAGISFPIFTGNSRRVNYQTSKIQLEQLSNSRDQLDQELELAVKSNITTTIATATNIDFSKTAADNASLNFELVREQYLVGEVNITQLIDAQQSALAAKLSYALAIYEYVQSQLQLEFAVGFFQSLLTEAELEEFNNRFAEFTRN